MYRSSYWYKFSHLDLHQVWQKVDRQFIIQNYLMMEGLMFVFSLGLIISSSFAIWLNTKSGQKWIDEL